jgi:hypothetical protein
MEKAAPLLVRMSHFFDAFDWSAVHVVRQKLQKWQDQNIKQKNVDIRTSGRLRRMRPWALVGL